MHVVIDALKDSSRIRFSDRTAATGAALPILRSGFFVLLIVTTLLIASFVRIHNVHPAAPKAFFVGFIARPPALYPVDKT